MGNTGVGRACRGFCFQLTGWKLKANDLCVSGTAEDNLWACCFQIYVFINLLLDFKPNTDSRTIGLVIFYSMAWDLSKGEYAEVCDTNWLLVCNTNCNWFWVLPSAILFLSLTRKMKWLGGKCKWICQSRDLVLYFRRMFCSSSHLEHTYFFSFKILKPS